MGRKLFHLNIIFNSRSYWIQRMSILSMLNHPTNSFIEWNSDLRKSDIILVDQPLLVLISLYLIYIYTLLVLRLPSVGDELNRIDLWLVQVSVPFISLSAKKNRDVTSEINWELFQFCLYGLGYLPWFKFIQLKVMWKSQLMLLRKQRGKFWRNWLICQVWGYENSTKDPLKLFNLTISGGGVEAPQANYALASLSS